MSNLQSQKGRITYTWTFPNIKQVWEVEGASLMSECFSMEKISMYRQYEMNWRIIAREENQNGTENRQCLETCNCENKAKKQHIALYVENNYCDTYFQSIVLKLRFAIIKPIQGEVHIKSKIIFSPMKNQTYGFSDYITVDQLQESGIQDLTIHCTMEVVEKDFASYKPLLCNHMFSDVKLIIGDEIYPAHKLILSMSSGAFRKKFGAEDSISWVKITDVRPEIIQELLRFMYTETVENLETLAPEIFVAATKYAICDLQEISKEIVVANLTPENLVDTFSLCETLGIDHYTSSLREECVHYVARNLKTMISFGICKALGKKDPNFLRETFRNPKLYLITLNYKKVGKLDASEKLTETADNFDKFEKFFNKKALSDITIQVGDTKFYAHRLILSAESPVFERMFESEMKEAISGFLEIEDIEPNVFHEVLRFMYTKRVGCIENIASDILIAANKYDVGDLKVKSENILRKKLTIENVSSILIIADKVNSTVLKVECLHFIIEFSFLKPGTWFFPLDKVLKDLDVHLLLELLSKLAFDYDLNFVTINSLNLTSKKSLDLITRVLK